MGFQYKSCILLLCGSDFHWKSIDFLKIIDLRKIWKLDWKIKEFLFYMYIAEIDLGGHGECAECNLGPYRFEKPSKNQLKFMKTITIWIPFQMDIVYFDDFRFRKKAFAWCSLSEHSSELAKPFFMILGALKRCWSSVFCDSKIIPNKELTAKPQHETCERK